MALINCPQCGKEISEKALECPSCGFKITKEDKEAKEPLKCEECGNEIPGGATSCSSCGCPVNVDIEEELPQKVEVTNVNLPKFDKKKITRLIIVMVACLIVIVGIKMYRDAQAEKAAEEAANAIVTMIDNLGTPAYYQQSDIDAVTEAYNNLTDKEKGYVLNFDQLKIITETPTQIEQVGINLASALHDQLYNPDSLEIFSLVIQDGTQDEKYNCALCTIDYSGMNKMGGQTRKTENFILWGKEAEYDLLFSACGDSLSLYSEFLKLGNKMPYKKIKVDPERIISFIE